MILSPKDIQVWSYGIYTFNKNREKSKKNVIQRMGIYFKDRKVKYIYIHIFFQDFYITNALFAFLHI